MMNKLHRTIQHNRHRYQHSQMNQQQEEHEPKKEMTYEEVVAFLQSQQKQTK